MSDFINITKFGEVGLGNDDSDVFNLALSKIKDGQRINLPYDLEYNINKPLIMPDKSIEWTIGGVEGSRPRINYTGNGPMLKFFVEGAGISNVEIFGDYATNKTSKTVGVHFDCNLSYASRVKLNNLLVGAKFTSNCSTDFDDKIDYKNNKVDSIVESNLLPVVNMLFNTGQSNSDESPVGDTVITMAEEGVENPVYSENPFPGTPFRQWASKAGFKEFMDGSEDVKTVTSVNTSNPRAVFTSAGHGYAPTNFVIISGADQPEANGFFRLFNRDTNTFEITEETLQGLTITGNITVKRAGCIEKWEYDIDQQIIAGNQVNIIGMMYMQGNGNSNLSGALSIEWAAGRYFALLLKDLFKNTYGAKNSVIIDPGFAISFGLTSNHGGANDDPQKLFEARRYQMAATKYQDDVYWVDSMTDQRIADGVHIADMTPFHRAQIRSILDLENKTSLDRTQK